MATRHHHKPYLMFENNMGGFAIRNDVINKQTMCTRKMQSYMYTCMKIGVHFKFSASSFWQLAWCSNWSSSQMKLSQNEHLKTLPPWSQTPLSHSIQEASVRGQVQAWVVRHLRPWQTQASQKSQIAPWRRSWGKGDKRGERKQGRKREGGRSNKDGGMRERERERGEGRQRENGSHRF